MGNIGYFFPFFFVGGWIAASFLFAQKGWKYLAERFTTGTDFTGQRVGIISASINSVDYKNCIVLKYNEEGIYLRPTIPFRLFHKPVLIPWKEIKEVRDKKVLFFSFKELIIGQPFVVSIGLSKRVYQHIESSIAIYSKVLA